MDTNILKLLEQGWDFVLLALIVWYAMAKWLPYVFDKQNERLREQDIVYKDSLTKISDSFITYMEKSMGWHEKHSINLKKLMKK